MVFGFMFGCGGFGFVCGGFYFGGVCYVICYKCGGFNYYVCDCQVQVMKCYVCGKFGYILCDCIVFNGGFFNIVGKICYQCGEVGYIFWDCFKCNGVNGVDVFEVDFGNFQVVQVFVFGVFFV